MADFYVKNQTTGISSGIGGSITINSGDSVSLMYNALYESGGVFGTKVHFVVAELNRDLRISPTGADTINTLGYAYPYLNDPLPAGTYTFYAWDEVSRIASTPVTVTVTTTPFKIFNIYAKDIGNQWITVSVSTTGAGTGRILIDGIEKERFTVTANDVGYGSQFRVSAGSHTVCVEVA